jgi:HAD superfamily hydrolase (TIGR01509 family)
MHSWPAAVLFDFDGVIVNSEPLHFQAFYRVMAEEGVRITENEYYEELIGFDDRGAFKKIFEKYKKPADPKTMLRVMTGKSRIMMDLIYKNKYSALPGVEELVRGVWRHYPLAIVSGALREEIEVMLEGVSLRDCFSIIVAAEDVTVPKPDPAGYQMAAKMIGEKVKKAIRAEDCLVVEDAVNVCQRARKVGFKCLAVATSYPREKFDGVANWVVDSLRPEEVERVIPGLKVTK